MEYDHNSNLCKAVDHSPSGRCVKKQHGHPHHIVDQPWVQYARGFNGSIGQDQRPHEHKNPCSRRRELLNKYNIYMYIHTKCGKQVHLQDEIVHLWRKK